ncbi:MAG TPA: hypothetical protein PK152_07540 [Anaerolineales bacterium]|nr:hypothetical protein [Anaerolineales bacterium]HRK88971.1 hypothetical protein [Anaerolineales bacterium]
MNFKQLIIFGFSFFLFSCSSLGGSVTTPTPDIETIGEFFERCPTLEEVAQVNADLKITIQYDPTAGVDVCHAIDGSANLSSLQKRIYQTVFVMKLLNFSRPLPWTNLQLYEWLTTAIEGLRFVRGGISHCCEPENVIVIALNEDSMLLLTDQWVMDASIHGLMDATLLYAHEARHNEGFLHVCTTRNGDDNTLDEMGAWAISHYLALWIAQYGDRAFLVSQSGSPERFREAALQQAEITRLTRFCKEIYAKPTTTLAP